MQLISIVTPCFNEEENVTELYNQIKSVFKNLDNYKYEHIFIDNASTDNTVKIIKDIAKEDKNVKLIVNAKNFGHIRSPYYAMLQCSGDAIIVMASDLQEPPHMLAEFIKKWEEGYKIVIGVKNKSKENPLMFMIRKVYYNIIERIAEVEHIKNFTGFGLYDKSFIDILRKLDEPYPYFRGLVAQFGTDRYEIEFVQQKRKKGKTKNNFYTLYDMAMLGFVNHSKVPLRMASFIGFISAFLCFLVAIGYLIFKLFYWKDFQVGIAPLLIGFFFFASIQLFFIGLLGEYIISILTYVKKQPLVIEKERVNF